MAKSYDRREGHKVIREATLTIPDRGPNEDSITPNQIAYIQRLAPDFNPDGGLESLGKWQASDVIDQIKTAKGDLEADIATGNVREAPSALARRAGNALGSALGRGLRLIGLIVLAVIVIVIFFGNR